jgi:streptogramin lyase
MKRLAYCLLAACAFTGTAALAQGELNYTATDFLKYPASIYAGEVSGVATNAAGHVFVIQRAGNPYASLGGSRIFVHGEDQVLEFDQTGKFVREIAKGNYSNLVSNSVRVDAQNNIWTVDRSSGMVIKYSPDGARILLMLGRKPESINITVVGAAGRGAGGGRGGRGAPGAGGNQDLFPGPTDVAFDAAGNIFVSDGVGANNRVAKFTRDGVFAASFGKTGSDNESLNGVKSLAVDAVGNVYVADAGNKRIQVLSNDLKSVVRTITGVGDNPAAVCVSPGAHPYLYVSNSNAMNDLDHNGEIYRVELTGQVVGKFGHAGKAPREFASVNQIDCRQPDTLYTAEAGAYRVQKVTLR